MSDPPNAVPTRRELDALRVIVDAWLRTGLGPTNVELGERLAVNRQRAHALVADLRGRGLVRADTAGRVRGAVPTDEGRWMIVDLEE